MAQASYASTLLLECPITKQTFRDPVVAEDGHTYERAAIVKWIQENNATSPKTRQPLTVGRLVPNLLIRQLIDEHFDLLLRKKEYVFKLGEDVKKLDYLFEHFGKKIYTAEWIEKPGETRMMRPPIVLMSITGARAKKEAMFYVEMSKHAYIVRTYGLVANPRKEVMLVQERAEHRSLMHLLRTRDQPISEMILKEMFIQIADGLAFLAHNNIVHGDVACRNVLVFKFDEQNLNQTLVKVADFGLSRGSSIYESVSTSASTTLNVVPVRCAAPEILRNPNTTESYTEKSDMYSTGVLMWEAYFLGERPWLDVDEDSEVKRRVINGERLQQPPTCSTEMWSLIQTTMLQLPSDRPSFAILHRQLIELTSATTTQFQSIYVETALKAIKENQTSISLSNAGLRDEEIRIIAKELEKNTSIRNLRLDNNNLGNGGAQAIAELLEVNKTITHLSIINNNISSDGAAALARALRTNQTLTDLVIDKNPLYDIGIQAICEALKSNKTLMKLGIYTTHISSIGIKLITEMLREPNLTLAQLNVGNNGITDNDAELIAEALKVNTSLNWLDAYSMHITDMGASALAEGITSHRRRFVYFTVACRSSLSDLGRTAIETALR